MKKGLVFVSGVLGVSVLALVLLIVVYLLQGTKNKNNPKEVTTTRSSVLYVELPNKVALPEWTDTFESTIVQNFLPVNPYSRPGTDLKEVKGVVIHYVGNPNTTAEQNRSYFENLATTHETNASSHFIIGLGGEIIQCVPLDEIAYASNKRNEDTISIECCHSDTTGQFSEATLNSLVKLTAYLCILNNIDVDEGVIRHYDITGKACPKYFVDYENQWTLFKSRVKTQMLEK